MQFLGERTDPLESIAGEIRQVSFRYGMPEAQVRALLGSPNVPPSEELFAQQASARLAQLIRTIELAGTPYWISRVRESSGAEALFDRDLRFLAISLRGRTLSTSPTQEIELPEGAFVGSRYLTLLPTRDSLLGDSNPGLEGLKELGFFDGALCGVQLRLEMNFGFHFILCDMEIWAVPTLDRGILGHSQIHKLEAERPSIAAPGVKVHSVTYC